MNKRTLPKLTHEQLARLLHKAAHEPRRNQKRYLKDLGGEGSAEELDAVLEAARASGPAGALAAQLDRRRQITAKTVEAGVDGRVAEMLADIRLRMQDLNMDQGDVAAACGWTQSLVSQYLNGLKEPGAKNLAKLAAAVGCVWRLKPTDTPASSRT